MEIKRILYALAALVLPFVAEAQSFAVLPDAPDLKKGVLPNGTSYYIFRNTVSEGIADFALVQKAGTDNEMPGEEGCALKTARKSLSWSSRLGQMTPQQFVISKGAVPGRDGFVKVGRRSTTYWFDDVPVLEGEAAVDSALLVIFDIIDKVSGTEEGFLRRNCQPSRQAVIISGDVDPDVLVGKMKMLSMMTPAVEDGEGELSPSDVEEGQDVPDSCAAPVSEGPSSLSFVYRMDRVPYEYMNTVYPAVTSKYIRKMGFVVERRLKLLLEASDIPYTGLKTRYIGSREQGGDERFIIDLTVDHADLLKASKIVGGSLYSMHLGQISMDEQHYATGVFSEEVREWAIHPIVRNTDNVQRAAAAFLFGAPLTSPLQEMDFLLSKEIPDSTECRLLNNFSKAILCEETAVEVLHDSSLPDEELGKAFHEGWVAGDKLNGSFWALSGLGEPSGKPEQKIKVKRDRPEPVTGGRIWTYSNGMVVIYKQMPVGEHLYGSLIFNRGFASLENLKAGEGILLNDILNLYDIHGVPGRDFRDALLAREVKLDCTVSNSSTSIGISAPDDSLALVMDVMSKVLYERSRNAGALGRYARTEPLAICAEKGSRMERIQLIDSIMSPSSPYTAFRRNGCFSKELLERADRFFEETFSNLSEAVMVVVSSRDEDEMKRKIAGQMARFHVQEKSFRKPTASSFQPQAGSATYTVAGEDFSADIAISSRIPLTSENYVLAQVASIVLQERLIHVLADAGVNVDMKTSFRKVPQERFNILLSLSYVDEDGFVEGTLDRNSVDIMRRVRAAVTTVPDEEEIGRSLLLAKSLLKSRHEHMRNYPDFQIATIKARYLDGKDLYSKYISYLESVDVDMVAGMYRSISRGSSVEYITDRYR